MDTRQEAAAQLRRSEWTKGKPTPYYTDKQPHRKGVTTGSSATIEQLHTQMVQMLQQQQEQQRVSEEWEAQAAE